MNEPYDLLLENQEGEDYFGNSLGYGDFDGDGYVDLAVGAQDDGIFIFPGSASGFATTADSNLRWVGHSLASVGDINGDGYDDLMGCRVSYSYNGYGHLYTGSSSGLAEDPITFSEDESSFGRGVHGLGDVNGDGYGDVGVYGYGTRSPGFLFIYEGDADGPDERADTEMEGANDGDYFGTGVAALGDINGDGYDDVAIAASGIMTVYIHHGDRYGLDTRASATLTGTDVTFGATLVLAGDLNGDGYPELAVGAPDAYTVSIFDGNSSGFDSTPSVVLNEPGGCFGCATAFNDGVAALGDSDGDGYDDLAVAMPDANGRLGEVYIYHGSATGLDSTAGQVLASPSGTAERFGSHLVSPGDLDGDGLSELFVSAYAYDSYQGRAYLYSGAYRDGDGDGYTSVEDCDDADASVYPDAPEVCNDVDDDCDALTDDADDDVDLSTGGSWYADADGDGYGDPNTVLTGCEQPSGSTTDSSDCDDSSSIFHPEAVETCNNVDEDCDDVVDEDAVNATEWFADADGDGYTTADSVMACDPPEGYAAASDEPDCDDADPESYPGAGACAESSGDDTGSDDDTGEPATDDTGAGEDKDGGCSSSGGGASWVLGLFGLVALRRRALA